jgi:hypothetical protein
MPSIPVFPTNDSSIAAAVPPPISFPTDFRVGDVQFPEISLRKGFPKEANEYYGDKFVFLVGQMYLLAKYGGKCIIAEPVRVVLKVENLEEPEEAEKVEEQSEELEYSADFDMNLAFLSKQIKACFEKHATVIFMELQIDREVPHEEPEKHSNLLIYRPYKKTVERYDPHGYGWDNNFGDNLVDEQVAHLFENSLDLGRFTPVYKPAYLLNSNFGLGLQMLQNNQESFETEKGYCQVWSLFMMETVLMNPIQNTVDIVNASLRFVENDPQLALDLIRDYWRKIVEDKSFKHKYARASYYDRLKRKVKEMRQRMHVLPKESESEPALVAENPVVLGFEEVGDLRRFVKSLPIEDLRTLGKMFGIERITHLIHYFLQKGYTVAMVEDLLRPKTPGKTKKTSPNKYWLRSSKK